MTMPILALLTPQQLAANSKPIFRDFEPRELSECEIAIKQWEKKIALNYHTLQDLLEIAADQDTGALYQRIERYRQQLSEI